jgi:anti-sigma-K factor RskA
MAEHEFAGLGCSDVVDFAPAFVLGALTASESDAVRRHLAACPEAHPEMAELHSAVPALFEAVEPMAPPVGLKARILAAAAADLETRQTPATARPAVPEAPAATPVRAPAPPAPGGDEPRRGWDLGAIFRRPVWAAAAGVALIAAIALGAWNIQLRNDLAGLEAYRNGVVEVLDRAAQPGAQLAVLTAGAGTGGPSGLAAVAADGSVALVMRDLSPTSGTQVYEAWLIGSDKVPVPIGGFSVGGSGSASFTTTHAALGAGVTVALTLEPNPGATKPTLPIVAAGAAKAQSS